MKAILASYNDEDIYLFDARDSRRPPLHRYCGHRNMQTVKGVSFFGPNSEYIVSGSDDRYIYIWDRESEGLVQWILASQTGVVNAIEPHPSLPVLATAGLDYDVKIWSPICARSPWPSPHCFDGSSKASAKISTSVDLRLGATRGSDEIRDSYLAKSLFSSKELSRDSVFIDDHLGTNRPGIDSSTSSSGIDCISSEDADKSTNIMPEVLENNSKQLNKLEPEINYKKFKVPSEKRLSNTDYYSSNESISDDPESHNQARALLGATINSVAPRLSEDSSDDEEASELRLDKVREQLIRATTADLITGQLNCVQSDMNSIVSQPDAKATHANGDSCSIRLASIGKRSLGLVSLDNEGGCQSDFNTESQRALDDEKRQEDSRSSMPFRSERKLGSDASGSMSSMPKRPRFYSPSSPLQPGLGISAVFSSASAHSLNSPSSPNSPSPLPSASTSSNRSIQPVDYSANNLSETAGLNSDGKLIISQIPSVSNSHIVSSPQISSSSLDASEAQLRDRLRSLFSFVEAKKKSDMSRLGSCLSEASYLTSY
ncbi:unnamed protein product [Protopolystoma xenopodis]|uniref:Uncharacterized protein n=1 Tax=Protopolystoma xenopodis TaxID=117903 RepID=A0A3S5ABV5_9PLAT|nr:unnamed protein product [Protopolystoma xenopodis]